MQEWVVVGSLAGLQLARQLLQCQITTAIKARLAEAVVKAEDKAADKVAVRAAPLMLKHRKVKVIRSMSVIWILA